MLQPGTRLAQRYEVVRLIGEGGMGEVYEARHVEIQKRVAIKILNSDHVEDEETLTRFHQEARIAGNLGHVNICEVLDYGLAETGQPFLVMEYLEGINLKDLIRREGRLPVDRALAILDQVLFALTEAHANGIIHRDLKPENVFLAQKKGQGEVVKLLDFGISKVSVEGERLMRLTRTGTMVGTPYYMSPEQVRQEDDLDHRVDIYACGVILYEMIVGKVPFGGRSFNEVIVHILEEELAIPADISQLDPQVRALLESALEKDREKRPLDAAEFRDQIGGLLHGEDLGPRAPVRSGSGNRRADLMRRRWKKTALFVLMPLVAMFTLAGGIAAWLSLGDSRKQVEHDNLFPVPREQRWGFVDEQGEMAISPIFDGAGDFSDGMAKVRVGQKWGYVNRDGEMVIEPTFVEAGSFHEGLAPVRVAEKWGYVNRYGKMVITPVFDGARTFSEGLAPVRSGDRWGYVDGSGKVVIDPQFFFAGPFREGLAAVETGKESLTIWGYVQPEGTFAINPVYAFAGPFSEGKARVKACEDEGRELCPWRFIDARGRAVFQKDFDWAADYSEGLALVMSGGRWGFVDGSGHWAIDPRYAQAGSFSSGLARVVSGGRWGFIDKQGMWAIQPRFYLANDFNGEAAAVAYIASYDPGESEPIVRETAYIDPAGRYIWNEPSRPPVNEPPGFDRSIFNFDFLTGKIRVIGSFDPSSYELKFRQEEGSFTTVPLDLPHPVEMGRIKGVLPGELYTIIVSDRYVAITLGWASMLAGETTLVSVRVQGEELVKNASLMELTEDARGDNLLSWALGEKRLYLLTRGGKIKYRDLARLSAVPGEYIPKRSLPGNPSIIHAQGILFVFSSGASYLALTRDAAGRFVEHEIALEQPFIEDPEVRTTYEGIVVTSGDREITVDPARVKETLELSQPAGGSGNPPTPRPPQGV